MATWTDVCPYPRYEPKEGQESNLFKPIKVGDYELQHRLVLAPLTRVRAPNHVPSEAMAEYYGQRGQHPGTLLITESTSIAEEAIGLPNAPGIWNEDQVAGWKRVFEAVHKNKSRIFVQIFAYGRQADPLFLKEHNIEYVGASEIPLTPGAPAPRKLSSDDVKRYVRLFAGAAKRAIDAGADGVEVHAANGYLLDQFQFDNCNDRNDQYGGSIENRARFTLEVIDAVVDVVGAGKVGVRFSPWTKHGGVDFDISPIPEWAYLVTEIERRAREGKRIAYVHLVEPRVDYDQTVRDPVAMDLNNFFTHIWSGPIIRAGNLLEYRHEITNSDDRTLVAVGRYFISNPDLVGRLRAGHELNEYDRSTFYWNPKLGIEQGYTDYLAKQVVARLDPTPEPTLKRPREVGA